MDFKKSEKKVAAIILNYVSWKDTLDITDVCHEFLGFNSEDIIVIDNNSPNESAEELEKNADNRFVFIKSDSNKGYAAGNNIGLRYAFEKGYDYGFVLNNDIRFQKKETISELLRVFESNPQIACVNPDVYSPEGKLFNRDAYRPSFFDYTLGLLAYRRRGREIKDCGGYGLVYRPQGCCMMLDLKKLNEVGYLDEHTFLYVEEPILAERLLKKNYLCACCTNVPIIHDHSKTVKTTLQKRRISKLNNDGLRYLLREYRGFGTIQTEICCLFNGLKWMIIS